MTEAEDTEFAKINKRLDDIERLLIGILDADIEVTANLQPDYRTRQLMFHIEQRRNDMEKKKVK